MDINATLIGQIITFALFVLFTMRYVWPPLRKVMQERQDKIAMGLSMTDQAEKELVSARRTAHDLVQEARTQALKILEEANLGALAIAETAKEEARATAERMKQAAHAEILIHAARAREGVRQELISLVLLNTEKILARPLPEAEQERIQSGVLETLKTLPTDQSHAGSSL